MTINDIRAFIVVARTGSISKAAQELHLTQPALSRRIQSLETYLGAPLLNRAMKPPTLTAAGRRVLDKGRVVLRSLSELEASCRLDGKLAGPMRLGVAHGLAEFVMSAPLDNLRLVFPDLELFVQTGWTSEMSNQLENDNLDGFIGLLPNDQHAARPDTDTLGQGQVVIVAPKHWANAETLTIADLHQASWILNPYGCSFRKTLEKALSQHDIPMRIAMEVLGQELQLSLVARGVGLSLAPLWALRASNVASKVQALTVSGFEARVDIALKRGPNAAYFFPVFSKLSEDVGEALRTAL